MSRKVMPVDDASPERTAWEPFLETWGHLDPQPGTYPGTMLFAHGCFGDLVVLAHTFACEGPWFYAHLQDFTGTKSAQEPGLYRFRGYYQRFKNGNGRFVGQVTLRPFAGLRAQAPPPQAEAAD